MRHGSSRARSSRQNTSAWWNASRCIGSGWHARYALPAVKIRSGSPVEAHGQQQRQREVVAQDAPLVHALQLVRLDVHRITGNRPLGVGEVDDLGQLLLA